MKYSPLKSNRLDMGSMDDSRVKSRGSLTSWVIIEGPPHEYVATAALKAISRITVPTVHQQCGWDDPHLDPPTQLILREVSDSSLHLWRPPFSGSWIRYHWHRPIHLFRNYGANLPGFNYHHTHLTRSMLAFYILFIQWWLKIRSFSSVRNHSHTRFINNWFRYQICTQQKLNLNISELT